MNKQFTFDSESAAKVLNHISASIQSYNEHGTHLFSETLKHRNAGRIEALHDMHRFLTEFFQINGLEILELETEELEPESEYSEVKNSISETVNKRVDDMFAKVFANAFSHFSK